MHPWSLALVLSSLFFNAATGGVVRFEPSSARIDPSTGAGIATFTLFLDDSNPETSVDGVDVLLLSSDLSITLWSYVGPSAAGFCKPAPCTVHEFPTHRLFEEVDYREPLEFPVRFAEFSLDGSGLPPGEYLVSIDPAHSYLIDRPWGNTENLHGELRVTIVPEASALVEFVVLAGGILFIFGRRVA
jgi:hypothetical protein